MYVSLSQVLERLLVNSHLYQLLRQHGGDYEQISKRMGRDRKEIKAKVKAEEKKNPDRIKYAFVNRLRVGQSHRHVS
jgi:Myb DNA-binding like